MRKHTIRCIVSALLCTLVIALGIAKMQASSNDEATSAAMLNAVRALAESENTLEQMGEDPTVIVDKATAEQPVTQQTPTPEEEQRLTQEAQERGADAPQAEEHYDELKDKITADEDQDHSASQSVIDFYALAAINEDITAWVRLDDTVIDYPVAQCEDNVYYLHHLFDRTENKTGTIFIDYRNSGDFTDQNTILYGHHMKSGAMFAALMKYKQQSFYDEHPTMMLYTPQESYVVVFFAGDIVPIRDTVLPCYYIEYQDEEQFLNYINEAKADSTFQSDVEVTAEDRLITLSTCTYEVYDARYVLVGKLMTLEQWLSAQQAREASPSAKNEPAGF